MICKRIGNILKKTNLKWLHTVKWLNNSISPIDGILTGTTNLAPSGFVSNGNEGVLLIPESSRIQASLSYLPTPPLGQDMTHGQFLSGV